MKSVALAIVLVGFFAIANWRYSIPPKLSDEHKKVTVMVIMVMAVAFIISLFVPQ